MRNASRVLSFLFTTIVVLPVISPASAKQRYGPCDQATPQIA